MTIVDTDVYTYGELLHIPKMAAKINVGGVDTTDAVIMGFFNPF